MHASCFNIKKRSMDNILQHCELLWRDPHQTHFPGFSPSCPLGSGHSSADITWQSRAIHPEPSQPPLPNRICDSIWLSDARGPRAGAEAAGVCWESRVQGTGTRKRPTEGQRGQPPLLLLSFRKWPVHRKTLRTLTRKQLVDWTLTTLVNCWA